MKSCKISTLQCHNLTNQKVFFGTWRSKYWPWVQQFNDRACPLFSKHELYKLNRNITKIGQREETMQRWKFKECEHGMDIYVCVHFNGTAWGACIFSPYISTYRPGFFTYTCPILKQIFINERKLFSFHLWIGFKCFGINRYIAKKAKHIVVFCQSERFLQNVTPYVGELQKPRGGGPISLSAGGADFSKKGGGPFKKFSRIS